MVKILIPLLGNFICLLLCDIFYAIAGIRRAMAHINATSSRAIATTTIWIEASWKYIDRLCSSAALPVTYRYGSMGPEEAKALLENDGRQWLNEEPTTRVMPLADLR